MTPSIEHYGNWPNAAGFNAIDDHRQPIELTVNGHIPEYAAGSLYRTGPGGYKVAANDKDEGYACSHWFDGFTVVHKFNLLPSGQASSPLKVTYSSYCQVDELLEHVRRTGRREDITFGQKRDPCDGLYRKIKTMFTPTPASAMTAHTANVGVVLRDTMPQEREQAMKEGVDVDGRKIMTVTTDANMVKQFDAETLEPLGVATQSHLHPSLSGPLTAAHASHDPETGDIFNYNLDLGARATYRIFRASPTTGQVDILATIADSSIRGAYLHSILLTENFVIVCVWPAYYKMSGLAILWQQNILDAIQEFDPKANATWLVVDRRHGRGLVKRFTSPAFFCFHTVNAWETPSVEGKDNVDITCELIEFDNLDILHWFYYKNMVSNEEGAKAFDKARRERMGGGLAQYILQDVPLTSSGAQVPKKTSLAEKSLRIAFPDAGDLPRFNPRFALRRHRYVWAVANRHRSTFIDGLVKTDTMTRTSLTWECDKQTPGEPIFIPRPGATAEDDGVVLTVVLDGQRGTSYLLCLDAQTMKELGRAGVGYPVGFGFHGSFVAHNS